MNNNIKDALMEQILVDAMSADTKAKLSTVICNGLNSCIDDINSFARSLIKDLVNLNK